MSHARYILAFSINATEPWPQTDLQQSFVVRCEHMERRIHAGAVQAAAPFPRHSDAGLHVHCRPNAFVAQAQAHAAAPRALDSFASTHARGVADWPYVRVKTEM